MAKEKKTNEKLCIKTGSQIGGWVFSSLDHVIHTGQKCTISSPSGRAMSADYKSVLDWRYLTPFWRNGQKSRKIAKFRLILTPPKIFLGAAKILKPVLGTPFQGLLPGKVRTTPPDPKGVGKNFAPTPKKIFWGEGPPRGK